MVKNKMGAHRTRGAGPSIKKPGTFSSLVLLFFRVFCVFCGKKIQGELK